MADGTRILVLCPSYIVVLCDCFTSWRLTNLRSVWLPDLWHHYVCSTRRISFLICVCDLLQGHYGTQGAAEGSLGLADRWVCTHSHTFIYVHTHRDSYIQLRYTHTINTRHNLQLTPKLCLKNCAETVRLQVSSTSASAPSCSACTASCQWWWRGPVPPQSISLCSQLTFTASSVVSSSFTTR